MELAGTGLDEQQLRDNQMIMESIQNRAAASQDAEESVRTLVSRLEFGAVNQKSMPRIIESKCIEKTTDAVQIMAHQQEQNPLTVNNQSIIDVKSSSEPRLRPVDIIAQVTVNNHISFSSPTVAPLNNVTIQTKPQTASGGGTDTNRSNKVGRNRNVDLAFSMNKNTPTQKESVTSKLKQTNGLEKENQQSGTLTTTYLKNAKNLLNHSSELGPQVTTVTVTTTATATSTGTSAPPPTIVSMKKVTHTNNNNNNNNLENNNKNTISHSNQNDTDVGDDQINPLSPRLVKWNTLSKFDEKNYVTNDVKLKQKPKYDEIEFEEFEVFDPNNPNNDCYDSLNSK